MPIGVDIEDIERFRGKSEDFLKRVFTPLELEYCRKFKNPESHLAVRFCAKEAVIKSLSPFGINLAEYNLIEVYFDENYPKVRVLKDLGKNIKFEISLSHDRSKAIAFVTAKEV
jgi:phosphopantetheine--protein transferase-like protein